MQNNKKYLWHWKSLNDFGLKDFIYIVIILIVAFTTFKFWEQKKQLCWYVNNSKMIGAAAFLEDQNSKIVISICQNNA